MFIPCKVAAYVDAIGIDMTEAGSIIRIFKLGKSLPECYVRVDSTRKGGIGVKMSLSCTALRSTVKSGTCQK